MTEGQPVSSEWFIDRVARDMSVLPQEAARIVYWASERLSALERIARPVEGKFLEAARADLERAERELKDAVEAFNVAAWRYGKARATWEAHLAGKGETAPKEDTDEIFRRHTEEAWKDVQAIADARARGENIEIGDWSEVDAAAERARKRIRERLRQRQLQRACKWQLARLDQLLAEIWREGFREGSKEEIEEARSASCYFCSHRHPRPLYGEQLESVTRRL